MLHFKVFISKSNCLIYNHTALKQKHLRFSKENPIRVER